MAEKKPTEKDFQGLGDVTGPPEMMGKEPKAPPAPEKKEPAKAEKPKKMAKGGYVRAADGCAQRGKTRGRMV